MKKELILPALALLGGAAGFGLRRWELAAALDPKTGLMAMDCPATWLLIALTAALGAVLTVLSRGAGARKLTPQQRFQAPDSVYILLVVVSAMLLLVSAGAGAMRNSGAVRFEIGTVVLAVLSVLAGVSQLALGKQVYRQKWTENTPILTMIPAFWALGWLILTYQASSRQPVLLVYVYPVMAVVCVLLGLYGLASLSLNKGGVAYVCVFCLLGMYLSLVALAGESGLVGRLQYLAAALYLTAQSYMLLRSAFGLPWPERMPDRAEEAMKSEPPEGES